MSLRRLPGPDAGIAINGVTQAKDNASYVKDALAVMAAVPDWTAFELSEFHVLTKRLGQLFCRFGNPLLGMPGQAALPFRRLRRAPGRRR